MPGSTENDDIERRNQRLKEELRRELSEDMEDWVEDEVEEEVEEELNRRRVYGSFFGNFKGYFIAVAATIMALGQFSEAVTLIQDGVDSLRSRFTNEVEYELLAQVHVGNTESYIEDLLGNPQVSRAITDGVVANYYYHRKFLLTLFFSEQRVIAYTLLPLLEDFDPTIVSGPEQSWALQEFTYSSFPANPKRYMVDHSKTISFYLELLDTGRIGLFVNSYLGNVALATYTPDEHLVGLYEADVMGTEEELLNRQNEFREIERPNLYGEGSLPLDLIQKSLLTEAEFSAFFGWES